MPVILSTSLPPPHPPRTPPHPPPPWFYTFVTVPNTNACNMPRDWLIYCYQHGGVLIRVQRSAEFTGGHQSSQTKRSAGRASSTDILDGTFWMGHSGWDILDGTFWMGHSGWDILDGTFWMGHSGCRLVNKLQWTFISRNDMLFFIYLT